MPNTTLADALASRDLDTIIARIEDDPYQVERAADLLAAWAWAAEEPKAAPFARSLLRVLSTSYPAVRVPAGWVETTGLAIAEQAMENVDDADGPTNIYGTLVTLEPTSEAALECWLEAVEVGDGYYDPESLFKAHEPEFNPELDPARREQLRAIELLVSFSLTAGYSGRDKARAYLARDRKGPSVPVSIAALEQARERLAARGSFDLPSAEELAGC